MIKSMTGYGRAQRVLEGYDITVEIKSVNHRYFEFSSRTPRVYAYLDERLKKTIHEQVYRGKVDAYVGITAVDSSDTVVEINTALAASYLRELRALGQELELEDTITLSRLAGFHDIYSLQQVSQDEETMWGLVEQVAQEALTQFVEMRQVEGSKMEEDILFHLDLLEQHTLAIEERVPQVLEDWRQRLYDKISAVLEDQQVEESRLLTEVAVFAEKIAVDEETARLKSHLEQFRTILKEPNMVGRKLDFLVQEINRETNTIGSKSQDLETTKLVVEMKSETEKIREQIQNIE